MRKILSLIPPEYRSGCLKVAALFPVKAILDLVGVAVLIPVIMLVLDPGRLESSFIGRTAASLGMNDYRALAMGVIGAVVAVLLVKVVLSLLIIGYRNKYLMKLYRNLSSRLFLSLYSRGLLYIKNHNSARMTFNVIGVCYNFVMGHLNAWMSLFGEVFFLLLLFAALLVYSAKATLVAFCAFIPGIALYLMVVRRPLSVLNREENEARREQNKLVNEAFKGYTEVWVNDAFPLIHERFSLGLENISSYRVRSSIIQSIPSYLLELSVVIIVALLSVFSMGSPGGADVLFLGVCAVALLKMLPSVRTIVSSLAALSATKYTLEVIADINAPRSYDILPLEEAEPIAFSDAIVCKNLSFRYEGDDHPVINNLNLRIPKGARFGIKGRTGAGKTTLFNLLLGLYPPLSGSVCVDGVQLCRENAGSWHKIVGYVPQDVFVADTTILENVALGCEASSINPDKVLSALAQASLLDEVNAFPSGIDSRIGEGGCRLSGGQKQRLGIARALYKDAQVLFFDEATSSLDAATEKEVNDAICALSSSRRELTIIVISHRESTISFCDTVFEL